MKKGFTLIELLACIALISILLLIVIPTIDKNIKSRKEDIFFTSAKSILRQIEYNTFDENTSELLPLNYFELNNISSSEYDLENSTVKIEDGKPSLYLIGKGRFDGMYLCNIASSTTKKEVSYNSCDVLFLASSYLKNIESSKTNSSLISIDDDTYRYIGLSPDNYVYFNCKNDKKDSCEIWRIVGIFDDQLKLVSTTSLVSASWDSSDTSVNSGKGINEWSQSDLMYLLNGYYYDSDYYSEYSSCKYCLLSGRSECLNTCNFSRLSESAKNMIDINAVWNVGASNNVDNVRTASSSYTNEKIASSKVCQATSNECEIDEDEYGNEYQSCSLVCNDSVTRTTTWTGAVGLISVSDYAYAGSCSDYTSTSCGTKNWLNYNENYWTINPYQDDNYATRVWRVNFDGHVGYFTTYRTDSKSTRVYPSVFLNENVAIVSGDGTLEKPYYISSKSLTSTTVKISFNTNGAENDVADLTYDIGNKYNDLPEVVKNGYLFLGWYDDDGNLVKNSTKATASVTRLNAHWVKYGQSINFINELYSMGESNLKKDNTSDENIRYYGKNPKNYISFNGEIWRIIGIINNKLKIVRDESLIEASWDSSSSSYNRGYGINEWSTSDIKTLLNNYYYGSSSTCNYCNSDKQSSCTNTCTFNKISDSAKTLISESTWYIGSSSAVGNTFTEDRSPLDAYTNERGSGTGKICSSGNYCNDTTSRTTTWTGAVGLISVSDYAYAAKSCNSYNFESCGENNWLNKESTYFTITPFADTENARYVWRVKDDGSMGYVNSISNTDDVYPSVFLNNNAYIISGNGTKNKPYIISNANSIVTVSFDSQGGKNTVNRKMVANNEQYGELPNPEKNGYEFTGWYTSIVGGTLVTSTTLVNNDNSHTLYARYEPKSYVITYSRNNGEGTMQSTICYSGIDCTLSTNTFTRENYIFQGWSKYPGGDVVYTDGQIVNNPFDSYDGILYAKWTKIQYTLTINLDGGQISNNKEGTYGSGTVINLGIPEKDSYEFDHWQITSGTSEILNNRITLTSNTTIKAVYNRLGIYTYIDSLSTLKKDTGNNKRYYGSNPDNYVAFNGETWRIIGNVDGHTKIIRTTPLIEASWDSSSSSINSGYGINEWSTSDIKTLLNNYYYGNSSTCNYCNAKSKSSCTITCSFQKLTSTAKTMILDDATWYTGSDNNNGTETVTTYAPKMTYTNERGSGTGDVCDYSDTCNDLVARTTTWIGAVGLINVSDYAYAAEACTKYTISSCGSNNWLNFGTNYWTITPYTSGNASRIRYVKSTGEVSYYNAFNNYNIYPTVYLKAGVYITGGSGTQNDPYTLAIE